MTPAIRKMALMSACALAFAGAGSAANADQIIKFGLSSPLSGAAAIWGRGQEWMCKKAAQEIKAAGGVKVKDEIYNFDCIAYDNKYSSAEGTKVAQTLLNRDGVTFMYASTTAPMLAAQSLTERQGALLFSNAWGKSLKGPNYPLTFNIVATPFEIFPSLIKYIVQTHPEAKTVVLLNANDATGKDTEAAARPLWEKNGVKVLTSDFFERGTTEFQPIAARLMSFHPDIVDLASLAGPEAGQVLKEMAGLGFKGVKVSDNGGSADALLVTSGPAGEGTYMGAAVSFDGPATTEYQRKVNEEAKAALGDSLGLSAISAYDAIYALKAGLEKAQSLDPKAVAKALPTVKFRTFYGGEAYFGGKSFYGIDAQEMTPIYITQVVNGKLVEKARMEPQ
jgi:branched-chain amino acid transport system substrate-binding protein